jgi:hypothetical protein
VPEAPLPLPGEALLLLLLLLLTVATAVVPEEVDVTDPTDDDEVSYELCEEVSAASGWCINSIDFRYILS